MRQKHKVRIFGLCVLAVVGVMAMSASAAQAKWLILVGGQSVSAAKFDATFNLGEMLLSGLYSLHCTGGTGGATIQATESNTNLLLTGSVSFTGCVMKDATGKVNKNCSVSSKGQTVGTISISESSGVTMEGEKTFAILESEEFSLIQIVGALCPIATEGDLTMSLMGSATLTLDKAGTLQTLHSVGLDDQELFYGEDEALLHDGSSPANPVTGSALEESGSPWAIQLVGL